MQVEFYRVLRCNGASICAELAALALQVNLDALGSCGAFVHGLEDECLSVRSASVEALTKLAIGDQELAMIALDFLVDMFNDEIEQVRLKAIESLTAISRHILLQVHLFL